MKSLPHPRARNIVLSTFVATAILASSATAEISILLNVDSVKDESSSNVSTANGSWLLIADTTGDGFGSIQAGAIAVGEFVGSNDLIISRGDFTTFGFDGVVSAAITSLSFSNGWDEGDPLAFIWFPNEGTSPATAEAGAAYGIYHSLTGEGTSAPWLTPSDATFDYGLQLLTTDGSGFFGAGTTDPANATANLQVGAASQDSDSDGMPDDWEDANGLDPNDPADALTDLDGDGKSNLNEYLADTDPNDPASRLEITSIVDSAGDQSVFALAWTSAVNPDVTYEVSSSTDMTDWTVELSGIIAIGATTQRNISITTPGEAMFFRVRAFR